MLILSRSNLGVASTGELIAPRVESCGDCFESRQNWSFNHKRMREGFVEGKTVCGILAGYAVPPQDIMRIDEAMKPFFDPSRARGCGRLRWFLRAVDGSSS